MKRREFITIAGGAAAAWPLAAGAQQRAMPVIGYLGGGWPETSALNVAGFRQGLREEGYVEGQNVTIEYRWAQTQYDRLPDLAADLVRRQVNVIAVPSLSLAALAAKAATATIPIVFTTGIDAVEAGLVASLNRPGGNVTGVNYFTIALGPKRLGLLRDLVPGAALVAILVNPNGTDINTKDIEAAAVAVGQRIEFFHASNIREIDAAFANLVQKRADAFLVMPDPLFIGAPAVPSAELEETGGREGAPLFAHAGRCPKAMPCTALKHRMRCPKHGGQKVTLCFEVPNQPIAKRAAR